MTGYLTDKFNLPRIEVTTSQIRKFMQSRNLGAELSREFVALLDECHFARYAPAQTELAQSRQHLERAEKLIVRLEGELSDARSLRRRRLPRLQSGLLSFLWRNIRLKKNYIPYLRHK